MAVIIEVEYAELDRARRQWDEQARTVQRVARRIGWVTGDRLSAPVAAEVRGFATKWQAEIAALGTWAEQNHDAFTCLGSDYLLADRAQAERLRSLLPWDQRHDPIAVL